MSETGRRLGIGLDRLRTYRTKTRQSPAEGGQAYRLRRRFPRSGGGACEGFRRESRHGLAAVVENPAVDVVIVATPHDTLADITLGAVNAGKHVLVEKPAARFASELETVLAARDAKGVRVHVGFNHRYHRSLRKAKELVSSGALGELMFIRGRYGHGGRVGYEKEWRADPAISGGGGARSTRVRI